MYRLVVIRCPIFYREPVLDSRVPTSNSLDNARSAINILFFQLFALRRLKLDINEIFQRFIASILVEFSFIIIWNFDVVDFYHYKLAFQCLLEHFVELIKICIMLCSRYSFEYYNTVQIARRFFYEILVYASKLCANLVYRYT